MAQNIKNETMGNPTDTRMGNNTTGLIKSIVDKKYLIIYIVSFMLSTITLAGEQSPFSISLVVACFANGIPAMGVVIVSLLGSLIKFGIDGALSYILTTIMLVITFFVIRPKYSEGEKNEQIRMGKNLIVSTLIIQLVGCLFTSFTIYDILKSITFTIIAYVFYKIFVNSVAVLKLVKGRRAFTIEEVIGTSLLLTIAITSLGNFQILGVSVANVLNILVVLILGWKNGILVGTTAGVTIGVTLGVITSSEPIMIAAYAISGMIAGVLNRFGRIGVAIGFALGNVVLAYVSNGYTVELIHFKEILIASIGLFAVPKSLTLNIENFMPNTNLFPTVAGRGLNRSKQVAEELNNVSDAIQDMAKSYKEKNGKNFDDAVSRQTNKEIFIQELLDNLEPYKENILYDDIANVNGKIVDKIFNYMLENQEIDENALIELFKECNSYIIGIEDKELSGYLKENVTQMTRQINTSFKICKSNFIWQKKIDELNKNTKQHLNNVSKAIKGMAKNIKTELESEKKYDKQKEQILKELNNYEIEVEEIAIRREKRYFVEMYLKNNEESAKINKIEKVLSNVLAEPIVVDEESAIGTHLSFLSKDKFELFIANSEATKTNSEESGDSITSIKLKDGNYLVALSDGMGTGKEAKESSSQTLRMLENLLLSGFDENTSIELINTSLIANNTEVFATLDIAIIDLYQGKIKFIKSGACPSYIKNRKRVQIIKAASLPAGIVGESNLTVYDRDIADNDILLMCTDGILDSNIEYKNKELWLKYMLEDVETENTRKISDLILAEAIDNNFGRIQDDLSVVICKFVKEK